MKIVILCLFRRKSRILRPKTTIFRSLGGPDSLQPLDCPSPSIYVLHLIPDHGLHKSGSMGDPSRDATMVAAVSPAVALGHLGDK